MPTTNIEGQSFQPGVTLGDGPGIEFTETMRGFVSTTITDDYQAGFEQGKRDGSIFEFTVTVTAPNIDRLIANPQHEALLRGTVDAPIFSKTPLRVEAGRFNLLVRDADRARTRKMVYDMPMVAEDGRRLHAEGFKTIHDDPGPDLWAATTTLYVTVRESDASGPVIGKGIVTIHLKDFQKQLRTMKAVNAANPLEGLK